MRHTLVLALIMYPAALPAQQPASQAPHTVSPGMSKTQVLAALGPAVTVRTASDYTYIFYKNSCGKQCGMNDLVVLRSDSVVDAIFRSPDRHYTGTSSSPAPIPPRVAAHKKPAAAGEPLAVPVKKETVAPRPPMRPAPANDTKPSIPVKEPAVRPAPQPKPAPKSP